MHRLTYPSFILRSHRGLVIFSVAVVAALQYFIIWLFTTMDYGSLAEEALNRVPPFVRSIMGEEFLGRLSLEGLASFGFEHPLVLALLAVTAISIPARHISGEAETGTLEVLLALPVTRTGLLLSLWASGSFLLLLITAGGLAGSLTAMLLFQHPSHEFLIRLLQIGCNLWLFAVLVMTYTLLVSVFGREGGRTGMLSACITLLFYFLHYLGRLWSSLAFVKPFNIFTYYQPVKLMFGSESFRVHVAVLLPVIAILLAASIRQFGRRDIP